MTGQENIWQGDAQGMAGADRLSGAERRSPQRVPGHGQEERLAVLPRSPAAHRRPAWAGADLVVCFGVLALDRAELYKPSWPGSRGVLRTARAVFCHIHGHISISHRGES